MCIILCVPLCMCLNIKMYTRTHTQNGVVKTADINTVYNKLVNSTEVFLQELNGRKEQQRVEEEEAEKMRKIKAEQVYIRFSLLLENILPFIQLLYYFISELAVREECVQKSLMYTCI